MKATLALPLLILLMEVSSVHAASNTRDYYLKKIANELQAWNVVEARKLWNELEEQYPDFSKSHELHAYLQFEEGDYAGADATVKSLHVASDKEFVQLVRFTAQETKDYTSSESKNFKIFYKSERDKILVPYALDTLERQRKALLELLGYAPSEKVRVEIVDNAKALAKVSTLSLESIKTTGTIALCKFNRIMFINPKSLLFGYQWQDTIAHEYVHLVVSKMSRNRVPVWIHEGIAKYLESSWRGGPGQNLEPAGAALLSQAVKRNKLIPFEKMHPSLALLPSQEDAALAYAEVFSVIEYIKQKNGADSLARLIDELTKGNSYFAAIQKVTRVKFSQFRRDWLSFLKMRNYPKEAISFSVQKLKFKEKSPKQFDSEKKKTAESKLTFGDFLEIKDREGRRRAHLGELLRERNRYVAAVVEFQKSYRRVGNRSPALSNRYAQSLMKTGQTDLAAKLLLNSVKLFPNVAKTWRSLGELYLSTSSWEKARQAFLQVVAIDPFDPIPHAGLIKTGHMLKDSALIAQEEKVLQILSNSGSQSNEKH